MSVACFMVERRNEREITIPPRGCDEHDDCERQQTTVEKRWDIVRVADGAIVVPDTAWWYEHRLPEGAMWWASMTQSRPLPTGPEDWPPTTADLAAYEQMTPEQRRGVTHVRRGQEPRQPSHLFRDGWHLMVMCPGHEVWNIDSRASNCTKPYDYAHQCWIRHGTPPLITVDKNGPTCAAGAGSIQVGKYHGFLQGGRFT